MRRGLATLLIILAAAAPARAVMMDFCPDVPTSVLSAPLEPWWVMHTDTGTGGYSIVRRLPSYCPIDGLHWLSGTRLLFSVEVPCDLAGRTYLPADVIEWDGLAFTPYLCPAGLGLGPAADIDAISTTPRGDLEVSFETPTTIGGVLYLASDLVELTRTGAACTDWAVARRGFDAAASGLNVGGRPPRGVNLVGAARDHASGVLVLSFDVPVDAGLPPVHYLPGTFVAWDGSAFSEFYRDPSWPAGSRINDFAFPCMAPSGSVANDVRAVRDRDSVSLMWPTASVTPPGFVVKRTADRTRLVETAAILGAEPTIATTAVPAHRDPGAVAPAAGTLLFYEVVPAASCGEAFFP